MAAKKRANKTARKQARTARPAKKTQRAKAMPLPDFGPPNVIEFEPLFDAGRASKAVKEVGADPTKARTAVYIHGIGNHPEEQVLVIRWDRALFGKDMGDRTRMAYWVNRARYPQPSSCDCIDPKCACHDPEEAFRTKKVLAVGTPDPQHELDEAVKAITSDPAQQEFLRQIGSQMLDRAEEEAASQSRGNALTFEAVGGSKGVYGLQTKGFGDALLRKLTDLITGMALPDVQDFLFEWDHRKQMEDIFLQRLASGGAPFIVVAHSQGTMIAYDVLRQLSKAQADVRLFVTIGSPLGLPPVRTVFEKWTKQKKLPFPPCVTKWVNVANTGDVVAFDPNLTDDIGPVPAGASFENHQITRAERDANPLFTGNAHSAMGYLSTPIVRQTVYAAVGRDFASSMANQRIMSDLVERIETKDEAYRHPVMIEVMDLKDKGESTIEAGRLAIDARLRAFAKRSKTNIDLLQIQHHMRFLSAKLNRSEIEVLRTEFNGLQINRVWQNAQKKALICRSAQMVQAAPAHQAYSAHGHGIEWALLDTGINHLHPHFAMHENIASLWDCTDSKRSGNGVNQPVGGFVTYDKGKPTLPAGADGFIDAFGHGTHVAGIIAGEFPHPLEDEKELLTFAGMAPRAKLHSFKVLNNSGEGEDAWILIALDKIAQINEQSQELRIHGVNLSLGGNFDPSVFGCGHTPLCMELRRLWRQGVLIVLAAGNEGFTVLQTLNDGPWQANLDLSIGDPANLEESIAVGSVHRTNPHTYGVSYFSSRGPTADGRLKPDVVAPGEKILSARADFRDLLPKGMTPGSLTPAQLKKLTAEQLYVAESGTSMASPHVSGVLAAFLSQRREFIGYPDRVKQILMEQCTDLGRDPYAQGKGIPNLVKMLAST
ncbi:S8 family serine peptidase [Lysobacter sp. 2RAF19]